MVYSFAFSLHKRTALFLFEESASRALNQSHGAQCLEANLIASKTPSEIQGKLLTTADRKAMGTRPHPVRIRRTSPESKTGGNFFDNVEHGGRRGAECVIRIARADCGKLGHQVKGLGQGRHRVDSVIASSGGDPLQDYAASGSDAGIHEHWIVGAITPRLVGNVPVAGEKGRRQAVGGLELSVIPGVTLRVKADTLLRQYPAGRLEHAGDVNVGEIDAKEAGVGIDAGGKINGACRDCP